jgi:NADPH2:quinone reductase
MRALVCVELGPADRLELRDVADPPPRPGEVVVDVRAAALNFPDTLIIAGKPTLRSAIGSWPSTCTERLRGAGPFPCRQ